MKPLDWTGLTPAGRYRRFSLGVALIALLALLGADLAVTTRDPWLELGRIGWGLLTPNPLGIDALIAALANTLAFALLGVALGHAAGFLLALIFHLRPVQLACAFVRSIHELFWALLFLQLFGLSTLTGLLAIALPYGGIFARVYAEILEESDPRPTRWLNGIGDPLNRFLYARLPVAWATLKSYALYRFECGLRSSAVLGFVGLPTLGFHLETAFSQGQYSEAAGLLYLFFLLIATLRWWMRRRLLPLYLGAALLWLPFELPMPSGTFTRFLSEDLMPAPLRGTEPLAEQLPALAQWLQTLLVDQALPGAIVTLQLSLIALLASGLLALGLFPLLSSHFFRRRGRTLGHLLLVVFRSIPELILAFVCLLVLGPSMLPAIIALALHNGAIVAHLIGRYSETLQLRLDAAQGLHRYLWELLPRCYPQFIAFLLYRWEVIMRETAILGILGIHTLGFYVDSAFEELRFDRALVLILITALLNMALDQLARRMRHNLTNTTAATLSH